MRFNLWRKGHISYGFGPNGKNADKYKATVGKHHSGVDWNIGYGRPIYADNAGYVYKVYREGQRKDNWAGVYLLCPDKKYGLVENLYGHCSQIFVNEGDYVKEHQLIGLEGNKGEVYSGGVRITPKMQKRGDRRGSHVHEIYRPVTPVTKTTKGKHYLNGSNGRRYKHGPHYYEIQQENDMRGCIDPMEFAVRRPSDKVTTVARALRIKRDKDANVLDKLANLLRTIGL